jgi:Uma2 family endonuclease
VVDPWQPALQELHRYTLDEYHQLIESGGLDEDTHVELLDGWLVEMSPKTPRHELAVEWLNYWLIDALDRARFRVRVGGPLTLASSEPEPDLTVVERDAPRPYHPGTASLVVEVARSSLARDLAFKAAIYARADVPEYWVLDLDGRRLVVHRGPTGDSYAERFDVTARERLTAAAVPLPPLDLDELLHAAEG